MTDPTPNPTFDPTTTAGAGDAGAPTAPTAWSALDWVVLALVALPFVVGIVAVATGLGSQFHVLADNTINELRIRDIGHHAVLIGPYSRDQWNHPGPAMYYALVVPYRLLGSHAWALLVGALLVNGAAATATVALTRRIGGRALMVTVAVALAVVTLNLGAVFVRDPWNPYLTVFPFALLIVACWGAACGRWALLPLVAAVATFEVQTHIAYAPLAAVLVLWGAIGLYRYRAEVAGRRRRWAAGIALAILAVMWAPPVLDQLFGTGNLDATRVYFMRGTATRGLGPAARVVGEAFTAAPGWLVGSDAIASLTGEPASVHRTPIPLLAVVFLAVALLTWRRQRRDLRQLAIGIGLIAAAAVVALARTPGLLYDYRLRFLWIVGALMAAATVVMVARAVGAGARARGVARAVVVVGMIALVGTTTAATVAATTLDTPGARFQHRLAVVSGQVLDHVHPGKGVYLLRAGSFVGLVYQTGLLLRLEEAGVATRVDDTVENRLSFGSHRVEHREPIRGVLTTVVDTGVDLYERLPQAHEIAFWSAEPRSRRTRDLAELRQLFLRTRAGDRSATTQHRIDVLTARTAALAVFESAAPLPAPAIR